MMSSPILLWRLGETRIFGFFFPQKSTSKANKPFLRLSNCAITRYVSLVFCMLHDGYFCLLCALRCPLLTMMVDDDENHISLRIKSVPLT